MNKVFVDTMQLPFVLIIYAGSDDVDNLRDNWARVSCLLVCCVLAASCTRQQAALLSCVMVVVVGNVSRGGQVR